MDSNPKFPRGVMKSRGANPESLYDVSRSEDPEFEFEHLQRILGEHGIDLKREGLKILEVGSGDNAVVDYLINQGVNAVGVDAETTRKEGAQAIARIEHLPFKDECFDAIFSAHAFDKTVYFQDHELMMREITRVLTHGGIYLGAGEEIDAPLPEGLILVSEDSSEVVYKKS